MKKFLSVVVIFICFLSFNLIAFGASEDDFVFDDTNIIRSLSNEYLIDSGCSIDFYARDNSLVASGYTNTYTDVDSIYVKVFIQKYDNGKWVTVDSKSKTLSNNDYVEINLSCSSSPGKYRAYAIHKITNISAKESNTTYRDCKKICV